MTLLCAGGLATAEPPSAAMRTADSLADSSIREQVAALERTQAMVDGSVDDKREVLRKRVRAAYKLLRANAAPDAGLLPWLGPSSRPQEQPGQRLRQRALLRQVLHLELAEWQALLHEQTLLREAHQELELERARADASSMPEPASLGCPVAGGQVLERFGEYRHGESGAHLSRRGLEISTHAGDAVRAVAAGRVRHMGQVRGLGSAVLVQHDGGLWSLVGHIAPAVEAGSAIERGQILGHANATRVYLEVRLPIGPGGLPVDPEPLIDWSSGHASAVPPM
jgi:murein DD-endopeptidase MepM/ murein hydrolase activator NlpD